MNEFKNYKKKLFCCNCGKFGHKYSKCNEPITSLGIIAIKSLDNAEHNKLIKYFDRDKYFNLVKSNTMNNNILLGINKYWEKFNFLMIRRKKTLGYIEFLRGRYDEGMIESYTSLFEQMVRYEIDDILKYDFDYLWNDLWKKNVDNKFYKNEYNESKRKFDILKKDESFLKVISNIELNFDTPEWGYPKGRRIYLEKNINCACREFEEETGLKSNEYKIITNIPPIQEVFYGTNNILYKHIYYFALCSSDVEVKIDQNNIHQVEEIGDIGWFNYNKCRSLIRNYHYERQKILNETFIFLSSIIENNYCIESSIISDKEIEEDLTLNNNVKAIDLNDSDDDMDLDDDNSDYSNVPFFEFES